MTTRLLWAALFIWAFAGPAVADCVGFYKGNGGYRRMANLCNAAIYVWYCGKGKHMASDLVYAGQDQGTNIYNNEGFYYAECTSVSSDGVPQCRRPNAQSMGCR